MDILIFPRRNSYAESWFHLMYIGCPIQLADYMNNWMLMYATRNCDCPAYTRPIRLYLEVLGVIERLEAL